MDNNPGDSSCESDRSDPWSFIDGDFHEADALPEIGSVSEELSDGESLEVIDEEERHEDEYKNADVETDEVSIITESEVSDEFVPLPVVISKEKKYLHHPNTYLNTRLNVLLAVSLAAVSGLGLGHFLGLQEECLLPNESATSLLEQLKQENALLRSKLSKHLEESMKYPQNWKCDGNVMFQSEETSHPQSTLHSALHKELLHLKEKDSRIVTKLQHDSVFAQNMKHKRNQGVDFAENYSKSSIRTEKQAQNVVLPLEESEIEVQNLPEDSVRSFPSERNTEYFTSSENNGFCVMGFADKYDSDNIADVSDDNLNTFFQLEDEGDVVDSYKQIKYQEFSAQFQEHELPVHSPSSLNEVKKVENMVFEHKNEDLVFPLEEENNLFGEDKKIYVAKDKIVTSSVKQNKLQNEVEGNMENSEGSSYMETIKSILRLLQGHHYNNIISLQTGTILSSTIANAEELELSVQQLHKIVYGCDLQKCDYNNKHLEKKMEVSINKLTDTLGELVEYLDKQIYKFLNKMLQKLTKFKSNMQDKWCPSNKRKENKSHKVNSLLQIAVLLDCEDINAKHKMKLNKVSSKESEKSHETNAMLREKKYFLKSVEHNVASNSKNQNNQYSTPHILKFKMEQSNNNDINNNIVLNHDRLSENHFKGNTPSEFYERFPSPSEDHKVTKSYEDLKYDEKTHEKSFNAKDQKKYQNKLKNIFQEKSDEKSELKKLKNDEHLLRFGKHGKQYVKQGHGSSNSNKKSRNMHYINREKNKNMLQGEKKFSIYENNQYAYPTILGKGVTWVMDDSYTHKKSNISGDWMLKIADARAAQRKLHHRSDWLFDRAHARKIKRGRTLVTGNWYFHRGHGREYCRIFPSSECCKTDHFRNPNIDKPYTNKYNSEEKFHHTSRWSKKFFERSVGKWFKNTITNLHNKIKYQSYR